MELKELLDRSIAEISELRRTNESNSRELWIVYSFCRLITPQREGAMHPDVLHELHMLRAKMERETREKNAL